MANIGIIEENNLWHGTSPISELVTCLEGNPFGRFEEMELNLSGELQPYNPAKAITSLKKGREAVVEFSMEEPFRFVAALSRGTWRNTISLFLPNESLTELPTAQVFKYLGELAAHFPKFQMAQIQPDPKPDVLYHAANLEFAPPCFNAFLSWYHLISPLGYAPYFSREELLAAPAHCVQELDNGWIEIISYADPLAYDQPETRERIVAMTNYLNALRHDWQPTPLASAV